MAQATRYTVRKLLHMGRTMIFCVFPLEKITEEAWAAGIITLERQDPCWDSEVLMRTLQARRESRYSMLEERHRKIHDAIVAEPKLLQRKRKAVSLRGAGLHGNDSGAESSSPHVQPNKRRPIACASTSALVGGTTRSARRSNSESMRPEDITPFTFQQEKWLFFYVTGFYPRGSATVDWNTVSADYKVRFNVGRATKSLEQKWEEMMERGVNMQFYFPGAEQLFFSAAPTLHPISTNPQVNYPVSDDQFAPLSVSSDTFPEPQDSSTAPPSSNHQPQMKGRPYTEEETEWLHDWVDRNTVSGGKKNWVVCDQAFTKNFKYSRGSAALMVKWFDGIKGSKASGTSARKKEKSNPPSLSASHKTNQPTSTVATSSQPVTSPEKSGKALPWTTQQEEWLLSYCSENFTNRGVAIDWDQAVEDYSAEWEIVRTANALKKKWSRTNIKLRGQAGTYDEDPQDED
ncbi:hypothetical protein RUND412_001819 [Rhizina undulata]